MPSWQGYSLLFCKFFVLIKCESLKCFMQRDFRFDTLKFLLIFLVVLGHLSYKDYGLGVNRLIYSFHMPLFVFLSGFFTTNIHDDDGTTKKKHIKWVRKTLLIFILAQLGHSLLTIFLGGKASWTMLIYPQLALWYLICLVYWRITIWTIDDKLDDRILFTLSVCLCLLSGIIPLNDEFSFQRAFAFFPFFVTGYIFRKRNLINKIDGIPIWKALLVAIICLFAARVIPRTYMPKFHYDTFNDFFARGVQTVLGFFLSLSVFRLSRCIKTDKIAQLGTYTLWIYIGHTYLIRLNIPKLLEEQFQITINMFGAFVLSTVYCFLFVILAKLYHRLR